MLLPLGLSRSATKGDKQFLASLDILTSVALATFHILHKLRQKPVINCIVNRWVPHDATRVTLAQVRG
jgi:hypothetical protein